MSEFKYTITKEDKGLPVKDILRHKFNFSARLRTKIKFQKLMYLNDEPVQGWIVPNEGDIVKVKLPEEKSNFPSECIPIDPVFEDEHLLIINKQPGVVVHPTKGHPSHTIANGLMNYMDITNQSFKIRFVNRLDMDTSGLLIIAKNSNAQDSIMKQMKANTTEKTYIALVNGVVTKNQFTIDLPIGRPDDENVQRAVMEDGGQDSVTHVKVLKRFDKYTLVQCILETGRTHQIRVHLTHIGHPLVGDYLYGGDVPWLIERQALHSHKLKFRHPVTGKVIEVTAPLPEDIDLAISKCE